MSQQLSPPLRTPERRAFFERTVQLAAALPLAALGIDACCSQRGGTGTELTAAAHFGSDLSQSSSPFERVAQEHSRYHRALKQLMGFYTANFTRTKSEPSYNPAMHPGQRYDQKSTTTWHVPENLPSARTLSGWIGVESQMSGRFEFVRSQRLVDLEKVRESAAGAESRGGLGAMLLTGLIFGGEMYLLSRYEDLLGYRQRVEEWRKHAYPLISLPDYEPTEQSRRAFIRTAAALAGVAAGFGIKKGYDSLQSRESHAQSTLDSLHRSSPTASRSPIKTFFGSSIEEMVLEGNAQLSKLEFAAEHAESKKVRERFISVSENGKAYVSALEQLEEVQAAGDQFCYLAACAEATERLQHANSIDAQISVGRSIIQGLGIAAAFAAVIIPGEARIEAERKFRNERS